MSAINHNHAFGNEVGHMVSYGLGGHPSGGGYLRHRAGQKVNARTARGVNNMLGGNLHQPQGRRGFGPNLGRTAGRMVGNQVAGVHHPAGYNKRMAQRQVGRGAGRFVTNTVNKVLH